MSRESIAETSGSSDAVPLEWPAMRPEAPPSGRTIRGLLALPEMLLLWFAPRRMGPVVAAAGWHAAIWASLIGLVIGLGLVASEVRTVLLWVTHGPDYIAFVPDVPGAPRSAFTVNELPFAAPATLAMLIYADTWNNGWSPGSSSTSRLILAAIPAVIFALAAILMPFAAAGERLRLLFGRCLRLVLWSITILIPVGLVALYWPWVLDHLVGVIPSNDDQEMRDQIANNRNSITLAALFAFALWWLLILWRSGLCYAGPADGPAWRPRTPRCGKCGYNIATLRLDARCPECNHPVADSVARLQRKMKPTRWRLFIASLRDVLPSAP